MQPKISSPPGEKKKSNSPTCSSVSFFSFSLYFLRIYFLFVKESNILMEHIFFHSSFSTDFSTILNETPACSQSMQKQRNLLEELYNCQDGSRLFSHFLDMDLCIALYIFHDQIAGFFNSTVLGYSPEIQPERSTVLVTPTLHIKWYRMTKCQVVCGPF